MSDYLVSKLQELPSLIEEKEKELLDLKKSISGDERSKKFVEIQLRKDINKEIDVDSGKLRFSNEKSRDDELFSRMGKDERAISLSDKIEDDNYKLELAMIGYKRLLNEFKAFRSIATIKGGK
jgi:hypothetical protein